VVLPFFETVLCFAADLLFAEDLSFEVGGGIAAGDTLSWDGAIPWLPVLFVGLLAGYGVARLTITRTLGHSRGGILTSVL
jgi:hypothetical protein